MTSVSLLVVAALRLSEPGWFIARFDEADWDESIKNAALDKNDEVAVERTVTLKSL